jgi:hypothetical protein
MQLSMGVATIPSILSWQQGKKASSHSRQNGQPQAPNKKSLMDILQLMEMGDKKAWLCVTPESNGIYTGYFSSLVEEIKS